MEVSIYQDFRQIHILIKVLLIYPTIRFMDFRYFMMRTYTKLVHFVVCLALFASLVTLYLLNIDPISLQLKVEPPYSMQRVDKQTITRDSIEHDILFRKGILDSLCVNDNLLYQEYNFSYDRNVERFYYMRSANVTYCKVPKAGSTLISKLFLAINGRDANRVHALGNGMFGKPWPLPNAAAETFKFLVARDPYSRLYSAYVDKYYLLEHRNRIRDIAVYKRKGLLRIGNETCGYDVTFDDFLEYSLKEAFETTKKINRHWSPIFLLCHACDVNYHVIVKQETLSRDLMYIMQYMNLSNETKSDFMEALKLDSTCSRIFSLYETRFRKLKTCTSMRAYAYRIWHSFKIQGVVRDDAPFPLSGMNMSENMIQERLCAAVKDAKRNYPLDKNAKVQQRQKYIIDAYKNIDKGLIDKIQIMYKVDFLAFSYDSKMPK